MSRRIPFVARWMMVLGGLLVLAGLAWPVWIRIREPAPVLGEMGAVVAAVTSPVEPGDSPLPVLAISPSPPSRHPEHVPTPDALPHRPDSYQMRWIPTSTHRPPSPMPCPPTPVPTTNRPIHPTRIVAPAIQLDAPVVPMTWKTMIRKGRLVSEWDLPKDAAGWHINSALPGQGDNVVISGHHNIEGKVFRHIKDLNLGDTIIVYVGSSSYVYRVSAKYLLKESGMPLEVREKNARWMLPTGDERLTLITCWPYEWPGNSHRVVVIARPETHFVIPSESRAR